MEMVEKFVSPGPIDSNQVSSEEGIEMTENLFSPLA